MRKKWIFIVACAFLLMGCTQQQQNPNYDEMKKMMTDALQTEDGKKALRKTLSDPEFRELIVLEQPEVKKSIEDTLLSKKGEDFWKHAFEDPKFTEAIAKSMKKQQQDIMTQLMNDSSFQKEMQDFFAQPDMQKQMETILKSSELKKQMEKSVEDTINNPLMQAKWQELILKAGEVTPTKGEEKGGGGQGGGGGGKGGGGQ
ncbi:spore germination lipoprotein GerD [Sporosarcina cyprini]|uniref:spore germination lipoprotein GerD n=1 Tax=Sporosarcina cyprini TaxID=2910523 RepID=UPI001EDD3674|nr:spore germination lipoprotein GerD [Sporosarcina cyprini]MCG3089867.1 spore gernimation protein [Sporosarcina cyprini]